MGVGTVHRTGISSISPELSILIGCFNQADTLESAIRDCVHHVSRSVSDFELIIINDGSTDGSVRILDRLRKEFPQLRVTHQLHSGNAKAIRRGMDLARGTYLFQFDLDQTAWLKDFKTLWELRERYTLILGHHMHRGNRFHQCLAWLLNRWIKLWFGTELIEPDTRFRLSKRELALEILARIPKHFEGVGIGLSLHAYRMSPRHLLELQVGESTPPPRFSVRSDLSIFFHYFMEIPKFRFPEPPPLQLQPTAHSL
jgi:hypothetical protein